MSEPSGSPASRPEAESSAAKPLRSFSGLAHSREFLETLAAVGRGRTSDQLVKSGRRAYRPLLLAMTAVVGLLLVLARDHGWWPWTERGTVPEVFHGTWATRAERYADRGFVITRDSLQLLTGPGRGLTYPIVGVSTQAPTDPTLFTFHYRDGGLDMTLRLNLEPDSTIHLMNLPLVAWTKHRP